MKKDRICKYCNTKFENVEGRVFSNHVRWCPSNTTNGDKGSSAIKRAELKRQDAAYGPVAKFTPECNFCKTPVEVFERLRQFPRRLKYFCSRRCANTHFRSPESRQRARESALRAHARLGNKKPDYANCKFPEFESNKGNRCRRPRVWSKCEIGSAPYWAFGHSWREDNPVARPRLDNCCITGNFPGAYSRLRSGPTR